MYKKIFDTIAKELEIDKNPHVYTGFREQQLKQFDQDFGEIIGDSKNYNKGAKAYLKSEKAKDLKANYMEYVENTQQASDSVTVPAEAQTLKLRARYNLATASDVKESLPEQVSDTVQAQLFNYVPPDQSLGENNSLFLGNRMNDEIRYKNAEDTPVQNEPNTLGFESTFNEEQYIPAVDQFESVGRIMLSQLPYQQLGGISVLPNSNLTTIDPFTQIKQTSYLIPIDPPPGPFSLDPDQPIPFGYDIGFKPDYDQWRSPMSLSEKAGPTESYEQQMRISLMYGPQIY